MHDPAKMTADSKIRDFMERTSWALEESMKIKGLPVSISMEKDGKDIHIAFEHKKTGKRAQMTVANSTTVKDLFDLGIGGVVVELLSDVEILGAVEKPDTLRGFAS